MITEELYQNRTFGVGSIVVGCHEYLQRESDCGYVWADERLTPGPDLYMDSCGSAVWIPRPWRQVIRGREPVHSGGM